jgi:hypothetical protein
MDRLAAVFARKHSLEGASRDPRRAPREAATQVVPPLSGDQDPVDGRVRRFEGSDDRVQAEQRPRAARRPPPFTASPRASRPRVPARTARAGRIRRASQISGQSRSSSRPCPRPVRATRMGWNSAVPWSAPLEAAASTVHGPRGRSPRGAPPAQSTAALGSAEQRAIVVARGPPGERSARPAHRPGRTAQARDGETPRPPRSTEPRAEARVEPQAPDERARTSARAVGRHARERTAPRSNPA